MWNSDHSLSSSYIVLAQDMFHLLEIRGIFQSPKEEWVSKKYPKIPVVLLDEDARYYNSLCYKFLEFSRSSLKEQKLILFYFSFSFIFYVYSRLQLLMLCPLTCWGPTFVVPLSPTLLYHRWTFYRRDCARDFERLETMWNNLHIWFVLQSSLT